VSHSGADDVASRGHFFFFLGFLRSSMSSCALAASIRQDASEMPRRSRRGGQFQDAILRICWRPTHNCSCWSARSLRKRKNEPRDATSSAPLCDTASSPPTVSQGSGRRSATTPDSGAGSALGPADRTDPPAIQFSCGRGVGASSARRTLSIATPFCDDTLGYFTERLDPGPTGKPCSPLSVRQAQQAFDDCRWIGLPSTAPVRDGGPSRLHALSAAAQRCETDSGLSTFFGDDQRGGHGLSLPCDGEPYGPGDSEYAAGQRLLRRVIGSVGNDWRSMWSRTVNSPPHVPAYGRRSRSPGGGTAERQLAGAICRRQQRFPCGPPATVFQHGADRVELWTRGLRSWETLAWKPFACSSIASTSRTARWWKPTG